MLLRKIINTLFLLIIMFLFFVLGCLCNETFGKKYNRVSQFGGWIDADYDSQDTRQEVLIRDSLIPVVFNSKGKVVYGLWVCFYTGEVTTNPSDFDIDHVVPLYEAFNSGADHWNLVQRVHYANYLNNRHHLLAVTAKSNREKGGKDISEWLPLLHQKEYVQYWKEIKEDWNLCFDQKEIDVIIKFEGIVDLPQNICN